MKSIINVLPAELDNQLTKLSSGDNNETFGGANKDLPTEKLSAALSFVTQSSYEQIENVESNVKTPRLKKQFDGLW